MTGYSSWFGILAGVLAIILGVYSLLRTSTVASWLESHGIHHAIATAAFMRQIKTLGVLFILASAAQECGQMVFMWKRIV